MVAAAAEGGFDVGVRKPMPSSIDPQALVGQLSAAKADAVETYHCRLVTPMYGGGVVTGTVDMAMPIRATGIRGQLRFWWRLLNAQLADGAPISSEALFKRERSIWGGLGDADSLAASKVVVRVRGLGASKQVPAATYKKKADGTYKTQPDFGQLPGYVLFPAQGKASRQAVSESPKLLLDAGASWQLELGFSDHLDAGQRAEVLVALRWWASFGGVGGRTRRGCGAVEVRDQSGRLLRVSPEEASAAGMQLHLRHPEADAVRAWSEAVGRLRDFRQGKKVGRRQGNERPGRSYWPEPDAIRRAVGTHSKDHAPDHPAGHAFPRAAFGMPIIFHFKDEREKDPGDTTLKPEKAERMASPLIIRPYPSPDGRWFPAVLRIDRGLLPNIKLSLEGAQPNLPLAISPTDWQSGSWVGKVPPMQGRGADALLAFLAFFGEGTTAAAIDAALAAAPKVAPPPKPVSVEQRFTAQIMRDRRNGAVSAKHVQTGKPFVAIGEDAAARWREVPPAKQKDIEAGRRVLLTAVVRDGRLIRLEDKSSGGKP